MDGWVETIKKVGFSRYPMAEEGDPDRIVGYVRESQFNLIEALAEQLAGVLLGEFDLEWLRLRITKQGVLREVREVGIAIERRRAT